nr:hypothetical protein [Cyanobacteria bacterium RUI128]
ALSQYGECASCTSENVKPTVSGYTVFPSRNLSGKKTNGNDSVNARVSNPYVCQGKPCKASAGGDASGYTFVMLPNSNLTGVNVYMSGTPAKGGKSAEIDSNGNPVTENLSGSYEKKDYISAKEVTSFIPQLMFVTNFTRRHYFLGDYGNDGEYLHFLKYSLDGPCQIQVGQGGPAFKGEYELYPSRTDMSTRIVCRGFEKSVQGGAPSIAIQDDQYDQYVYLKKANGDPVDTMSEKRVNSRNLKLTDTSYRTPKQRLDGELFFKLYQPALFNGIGEGGRGAGFVDKCTGKGKDKTDLNRYEGDFTISIGNAVNNSFVKTWKTEELESTCIDRSEDNQYGTVKGKYELIPAGSGRGGAVIITW